MGAGGNFMMEAPQNEGQPIDVGGRLRQLRQERGKSMRALARLSGLSTNALSMIERGRTSPSVSTLYKISDALEVPITAFFREEPPRQQVVFCQADQRNRVSFPKGMWEGLGGEFFIGHVEPFMLILDPGASSGPFGMLHTGHEFVMCIEGQLEYEVEDRLYTLNPGDSLIFAAQLRHRWRNSGEGAARAVFVLTGFEQGERPSEFHISSGMKSENIDFEEGDEEDFDENAEIEEI
jgi:transcriptional regulator with XRE-family HTH domain/mannose-6-phosphate isomerase-like protein (cupin superfamily)